MEGMEGWWWRFGLRLVVGVCNRKHMHLWGRTSCRGGRSIPEHTTGSNTLVALAVLTRLTESAREPTNDARIDREDV